MSGCQGSSWLATLLCWLHEFLTGHWSVLVAMVVVVISLLCSLFLLGPSCHVCSQGGTGVVFWGGVAGRFPGPGWKGTPFPASPPPYTTPWVLGGGALGPSLLPNHTGFRPGGLEMGDGCSDGCGSGLRDPSWLVCRGSHGKLLNAV